MSSEFSVGVQKNKHLTRSINLLTLDQTLPLLETNVYFVVEKKLIVMGQREPMTTRRWNTTQILKQ